MNSEPSFSIGLEEEYMLVDRETRDLIREAPPTLMRECAEVLENQVSPEFLQCQIEVGTRVCGTLSEASDNLYHLRKSLIEIVERHGLCLVAASTHPFAVSDHLKHTDKERYEDLAQDLQKVVRRLLICGMHVHVGLDDDELRIDLLGQMVYILPHLLALSTSSPFWQGEDTGLKSYRIAVWDEMPRTGLPESFDSYAEYRRHVEVLVNAGIIEDATKIWWDLRPSDRYPTLEMRIADVCTRRQDAICVAAVYLCWMRMLFRLRQRNQRWRRYASMLVDENRWRAHRYGIDEGLIDFGRGEIVPYSQLMEEILELADEDIDFFDCRREIEHAREIVANGTSAHRQVETYRRARADGAEHHEALCAVVDMLIDETKQGI